MANNAFSSKTTKSATKTAACNGQRPDWLHRWNGDDNSIAYLRSALIHCGLVPTISEPRSALHEINVRRQVVEALDELAFSDLAALAEVARLLCVDKANAAWAVETTRAHSDAQIESWLEAGLLKPNRARKFIGEVQS